jgi:hypothetical protein
MNKNEENNILEREENTRALRGFNISTLDIDSYVK